MKLPAKIMLLLFIPLLLIGQSQSGATVKAWIVKDRNFSREFLRKYIDTLTKIDPMADLEIQETDELRVFVILRQNVETELDKAYATSRGGALNKLDKEILKQLPPELIKSLVSRQYAWDMLEEFEISESSGDIVSVFKERNYKQCRDAFWWTHRRVDIRVLQRLFLRINPKFALALEFGQPEIGFPTSSSSTMNFGLATEVFKFYMTMPSRYPGSLGNGHPLDGSYGGGLKFDTPTFGGSVSFQDMDFRKSSEELTYYDNKDVIYSNSTGSIYYSFTNRIGSSEDEPGFKIPQGSLRMSFGACYSQFVYGHTDTLEGEQHKFIELDRTDPMELLQGTVRAEYASDMNDKHYNKWKLASQLNISMTGFGSLQFYVSRTILEWLSVDLSGTFFWKSLDFDTKGNKHYVADVDPDTFTWKPGWLITPSISIYF